MISEHTIWRQCRVGFAGLYGGKAGLICIICQLILVTQQSRGHLGKERCPLHGGLSPGAPKGKKNGNYTDGYFTAEAVTERRWARSLVAGFGKVKGNA